ncbi:MAG: hypothetical protein NXI30_20775 [bacterium]|nr:hypothetical protein [bacterium]
MIRSVERREDGWVVRDGPLPNAAASRPGGSDLAELLVETSDAPGPDFKVVADGASGLRLRAERHESDTPTTAGSLDFRAGREHDGADAKSCPASFDLEGLCREAGWPFEARSDGALVVDLGVRDAYVPAVVEARSSVLSVEAPLVSNLPGEGARRKAVAALLLRANGAFRMVCGRMRSCGERCEALLEAKLPATANASELEVALGSVAIAARHCAIEARMLATDERVARAYLQISGEVGGDAP